MTFATKARRPAPNALRPVKVLRRICMGDVMYAAHSADVPGNRPGGFAWTRDLAKAVRFTDSAKAKSRCGSLADWAVLCNIETSGFSFNRPTVSQINFADAIALAESEAA